MRSLLTDIRLIARWIIDAFTREPTSTKADISETRMNGVLLTPEEKRAIYEWHSDKGMRR